MPTFLAPLDLAGNELRNARAQQLAVDPAAPEIARIWYDTGTDTLKYRSSTTTVAIRQVGELGSLDELTGEHLAPGTITNLHIAADAAIDPTKLAVDVLDRANHSGTQTATTISDFDTQVQANRLDQLATPTGPVAMGGQRLTGLAAPTDTADAATKAYVDQIATGLHFKTAVRVATTSAITITSAPAEIDGVTLAAGDRVLIKDQADPTGNGIWIHNGTGTAFTRAADATELAAGTFVMVTEGATHADQGWILATDDPITVGTSPLDWAQFSGGGGAGSAPTGTPDRITVTGTQIDIATAYSGQPSITTVGTIATGTWQASPIGLAHGGTGATTPAAARTNLGAVGKHTQTIGDGATTTHTITHGLGTTDVAVSVHDATTGATVYTDVIRLDPNTIQVNFTQPPANNAYRIITIG